MNLLKISAFEYLLFKLVEWNKELTGNDKNDISVLKALKLLFFVSAVGTTKDSESSLLDDLFNDFVAMPYGHVESEIYDFIKNGSLPNITINNTSTIIKDTFNANTIDKTIRFRIDEAVNKLKSINIDLIRYSSFDLVDLSHSWYSWQLNYKKAESNGNRSERISISDIKSEDKIYQL
ncbi:MAG TPA: hypothetical protein VLZ83_12650 [Edaphocola sp.]|nr:hypothetical protein [Edaphocola sp.]